LNRFLLVLAALGLVASPEPVAAADARVTVHAGGTFSVPVTNLRDIRFRTTVPQRYDFSCGSAAAATLLTHHYERPTTEQEAFEAMYARGDREQIRREGFSLFDMKQFLAAEGYSSDGFRVPLEALREVGVPAITLVDDRGYRHFVVIKGLDGEKVLVGDPAVGLLAVPRARFEEMWSGVLFLIRDRRELGARRFNDPEEWKMLPSVPLDLAVRGNRVGGLSLRHPFSSDF
jgi:uncharacterized protein